MPRKVSYGLDYDDDAYDYEDYDYDYDEQETYEAAQTKQQPLKKVGVWQCPICTYDNEDDTSACDICGVLRSPLVKACSNGSSDTAPFKFDVPSPDELVSKGLLKSFKMPSTVKVNRSSSDVPSKLKQEKSTVLPSQSASKVYVSSEEDAVSSKDGGQPQSLTSNLNSMNLNAKAGSSKNARTRGAASQAKYKPEKWMLPDQAEDGLAQLNLAIVGHVDSGKSTLSGRLLHLLGQITHKEMHKYEKEAKSMGKGSFAYAWALDESAEERERGITMTVAVAYFDTNKYHVVVLDSPGHRDFVPNMITGATQADAAILVIDASVGAFEAGIDSFGGQTKEHAHLIRSFGVDQIIVAINKMDVVHYSRDRFDAIKQQVTMFLRSCGFKDSFMTWVPLSAMENQNLIAPPNDPQLLSWYKGPYLLEAIDSLQPPTRDYSKPVLMPICDVVRLQSAGQVSACGKLETGGLRSGSKVLVLPSGDIGTVRSLERNSQSCSVARAGDNVSISLQGFDVNQVMAGGVLCHPDFPVAVSNNLELKILVLDIATPILVGSQLEFHIHHVKEAARVSKISSLLDPKTGNVKKVMPRCLTAKQSAIIEVVLEESVCVEEFSKCKALGRAFLRSMGRTIAVGIVTKILDQPE
ncbi:HBS1-like protein isoform X2 [Impatiens glandulifera]|uniref:HBS1-like protein isoform X2 n=1 Tax=Impatiens glandulifera TaxID=253017 RepID=UPI001FB0B712|nr:HBS1-like protein isoform X2 [Impatiens glandulifera]